MRSVFYLTFEPSVRATESSHQFFASSPGSSSSVFVAEFQRTRRQYGRIATCWEILFAFLCSIVCSAYTLRYEDRNTIVPDSVPQVQLPDPGNGYASIILDPQPTLMLGACLVLGCSVSSFMYRRQEGDQYQNLIFCVILAAAIIFGMMLNVTANLIMLGLIPWALCLAMIFSVGIHWLVRRCSKQGIYTRVSYCDSVEKGMNSAI